MTFYLALAALLGLSFAVFGFGDDESESEDSDPQEPSTGNDFFIGANGELVGFLRADSISGTDGDDSIFGRAGDDTIDGLAGDDFIEAGNDTDRVSGGNGNDTIFGQHGADLLFGELGNDEIDGGSNFDTLVGGEGNDNLDGNLGNDLVLGGAGDDNVSGGEGDDTLAGGPGDDNVFGGEGEGSDSLTGGDGNDTLSGWLGADTLRGGPGDDRLLGDGPNFPSGGGVVTGDPGNDFLSGGDGNDTLGGNSGQDTLVGGAGDDLFLDYDLAHSGDAFNPSIVDGGSGQDTILVDGGSTITGGSGQDDIQIYASILDPEPTVVTDFSKGEDRLLLELELTQTTTDTLSVGPSADGTGSEIRFGETLVVVLEGAPDITMDDIQTRIVLDQDSGSLSYTDGGNSSVLVGNHEDNTLLGGGGDDTIVAGGVFFNVGGNYHGGSDVLNGGDGDDVLTTTCGELFEYYSNTGLLYQLEEHPDTLIGGDGNDSLLALNGGELTGGAGADDFVISHDVGAALDGFPFQPAEITDFDTSEDVLLLDVRPQYLDGGPGEVSIRIWTDNAGSDVLVDGVVVARVAGGQNLTVDEIVTTDSILFA